MMIGSAVLIASLFLFAAPTEVLVTLFVADEPQAELVRLVAATAALWAALELRARWKGIRPHRPWRVAGQIGVTLFTISLLISFPTFAVFAFPLLTGATLSTAMLLAESWRESVLSSSSPRVR